MFDMEVRPIVSVEDAALDREKMDVDAYARTRDPQKIVELPGQRARRYYVRRLKRGEMQVLSNHAQGDRVMLFVAWGLVKIDEPDGTTTVPTKKIPNVCGLPGSQLAWNMAAGQELDALYDRVSLTEFLEVASVIETMSGMRAGEAFSSSDERFTLLPASRHALEQIARRSVERTQTT